jgi:uncharacterized protein YidB (DUF937 family)
MGLLDEVAAALGGGDTKNLTESVGGLLDDVGGVGGLVEKFDANGLGDLAKSWVGTGANKAISPEMMATVLGSGELQKLATRAGITPEKAADGLSKALPEIIDKLTPDGEVPAADVAAARLKQLS